MRMAIESRRRFEIGTITVRSPADLCLTSTGRIIIELSWAFEGRGPSCILPRYAIGCSYEGKCGHRWWRPDAGVVKWSTRGCKVAIQGVVLIRSSDSPEYID